MKLITWSNTDTLLLSEIKNGYIVLACEWDEVPENGKYITIDADGNKEWYLNGEHHRTDGPAVEWFDNSKEWYVNGKLHREDGPAIEYVNGYKAWWVNGELQKCEKQE